MGLCEGVIQPPQGLPQVETHCSKKAIPSPHLTAPPPFSGLEVPAEANLG